MHSPGLIQDAQKGNLQAFNRLVAEFQESAFNLAYLALDNQAAAEEATQAAFMRAYQDLPRYRGGSFRTWLLKKLLQVCRPKIAQNGISTAGTPRRAYPGDERAFLSCILALPPESRLVLALVDMEGLGYVEAAAVLGTSPEAICSRLAQARLQVMSSAR